MFSMVPRAAQRANVGSRAIDGTFIFIKLRWAAENNTPVRRRDGLEEATLSISYGQ